jgi:hypothetical protein
MGHELRACDLRLARIIIDDGAGKPMTIWLGPGEVTIRPGGGSGITPTFDLDGMIEVSRPPTCRLEEIVRMAEPIEERLRRRLGRLVAERGPTVLSRCLLPPKTRHHLECAWGVRRFYVATRGVDAEHIFNFPEGSPQFAELSPSARRPGA